MLSKTTKNRFSYKLDKIFWFLIAIAPFLGYFLCVAFNGITVSNEANITLPNFFITNVLGGSSFSSDIVWSTLCNIFGPTGILPVFSNESVLYIFNWFIWVELFHLFFDVIVFIPRLAHKWISKAVQDD